MNPSKKIRIEKDEDDISVEEIKARSSGKKHKIFRSWKVVEEIRKESFAKIYLVKQRVTGKQLVLKAFDLLRGLIDVKMVREMLTLTEVSRHPNFVRLEEIIVANNKLCLVMERIPKTMLEVMKAGSIDSPEKIKDFVKQLLCAVDYLHKKDILHRDLHPGNILVDDNDDSLRVKISEFGLARQLYRGAIYTPEVGIPTYQAPEVLLGSNEYGKAIDIWSVGYVFAKLVTTESEVFERCILSDYPQCGDHRNADVLISILRSLGFPRDTAWRGVSNIPSYLESFDFVDYA